MHRAVARPGRYALRETPAVPAMRSTTGQLRSLYPFVAQSSVPGGGVLIGTDAYGAPFFYDGFRAYNSGVVQDANVCVLGSLGTGKSSLVTTYIWRQLSFGRWAHIIDVKPQRLADGTVRSQYTQLADAWNRAVEAYCARVGDTSENLGLVYVEPVVLVPGGHLRVNPLDAAQGRGQVLEDVVAAEMRRALRPQELTALGIALTAAESRAGTEPPTLVDIHQALLSPELGIAEGPPHYLSDDELRDVGMEPGHALLHLTSGPLRGMFDGQTTPSLRPRIRPPLRILDLSALHGNQGLGVLMMLADTWFQSDIGTQGIYVLEEAWRVLASLSVAESHQARYKLSRAAGVSYWAITHRFSDLRAVGDEGSRGRALVEGLLADSATRIVYRQPSDQLEETQRLLGLTNRARDHIGRLVRGQGFWAVGNRWFIVNHHLGETEKAMVNTDHAMEEKGERA